MKLAIFGAKSIALSICMAIKRLYTGCEVETFLVSALDGNPSSLAGIPVQEIGNYPKKEMNILIAVPEDVQLEIAEFIKRQGFFHYVCMDFQKRNHLLEQYFDSLREYSSLHKLPVGKQKAKLRVYQAKFHRDRELKNRYSTPDWIVPIQAGAALTSERVAKETDSSGKHISEKNIDYSELTALYWIWKNRLEKEGRTDDWRDEAGQAEYYGLFHYRRVLDIRKSDLYRMDKNGVDVVLPYPLPHEPSMYEHHTRYVKESEWKLLLKVLKALHPEYAERFKKILRQPYLYNYNIVIAKRRILKEYCEWLFPILEWVERLSTDSEEECSKRYLGYLGENLLTLYFLCNQWKLNIVHTGWIMLV